MKNLKVILTVLFFSISLLGFSQKVKIKKDVVSIDDIEAYKIEKEGNTKILSTLSGDEFISLIPNTYDFYSHGYK